MEPEPTDASSKQPAPAQMPSNSEKVQSNGPDSRGQKRKRGNDQPFTKRGRPDKGKNMGRGEYLYVHAIADP